MGKPTADQLSVVIDGLIEDLTVAKTVVPMLAEQARLNRYYADGRLPTASVQCARDACDGQPHDGLAQHGYRDSQAHNEDHSDPVGETVVNAVATPASWDVDRLRRFTHDLASLVGSTKGVLGVMAAATAAVAANGKDRKAGRGPDLARPKSCTHRHPDWRWCQDCRAYPDAEGPPAYAMTGAAGTSGLSLNEVEARRQRQGSTALESECLACSKPTSEVGALRGGLCQRDNMAWRRAGMPDRQLWLIDRRQYHASLVEQPGVIVEGPWGQPEVQAA